MDLPREWTAFGGASLALMGTAIAAGARRHAADNLAWRREWQRTAGALGILAGLGFAAAAAAGRPLTSARFVPGDARVLGRASRFLALEPPAPAASRFDERVAGAAAWLLCALWTWFGLRLILHFGGPMTGR